jgi:hypothetical protein
MNLSSCEQLTECICKLPHERLVKGFSTLWISIIQTVVDSLSNDIVEFLEELFFTLLVIFWVFNKSKRYIISRNPIQEEFLMLLEFWLRIANLTNNVPESIRDEGICMKFFKKIQPMGFLLLNFCNC